MPLSSNIDGSLAFIATGSGLVTSLFHWAAMQTSGRQVQSQILRGQMIASFGVGVGVATLLDFQTIFEADAIMAFAIAAIVGFVYGPSALVIAARKGSEMYGFEAPEEQTAEAPPEYGTVPEEAASERERS